MYTSYVYIHSVYYIILYIISYIYIHIHYMYIYILENCGESKKKSIVEKATKRNHIVEFAQVISYVISIIYVHTSVYILEL